MDEQTLAELTRVARKLGIEVHSYTMEGEFDLGKMEWTYIGRTTELYTVDSQSTKKLMSIRNNCITECNKAKKGSEWIYQKHTGKPLFLTDWISFFEYIGEICGTKLSIRDIFSQEDLTELEKKDPLYQEFLGRIVSGD